MKGRMLSADLLKNRSEHQILQSATGIPAQYFNIVSVYKLAAELLHLDCGFRKTARQKNWRAFTVNRDAAMPYLCFRNQGVEEVHKSMSIDCFMNHGLREEL